jgi:hypothetical protein
MTCVCVCVCVKDPSLESSSEWLSALYPCSSSDSFRMKILSSVLISDAGDCREAAVPESSLSPNIVPVESPMLHCRQLPC